MAKTAPFPIKLIIGRKKRFVINHENTANKIPIIDKMP